MKPTLLSLAAALGMVAATSTSIAQVYSVNAIGYVNVAVPANGFAILAVPLNGTNNSLNTLLQLPPGYDGCNIYRFDCATQSYLDTVAWIEGLGWLSASDPNPIVNPGEGFFFQNVVSTLLNISWLGEVPSGTLNNPIPGNNRYCVKASVVPVSGRLEDIGFIGCDGDNVYVFEPPIQQYRDSYAYIEGLGWYSATDPDPKGPFINAGQGFFIQRACPDAIWTQTFSVGP